MLKHLFLCRHAHAQEALYGQKDFDRDLSRQGLSEVAAIADFIRTIGFKPDALICSPAVRTQSTAYIIAEKIKFDLNKIEPIASLYEATADGLLKLVESLPPHQKVVIIVGHNPSVSEVAGKKISGNRLQVPTGGCCYFVFEEPDWAAVTGAVFKIKLNF